MGFDYSRAFGKPVRCINDAAMQALANYRSGRLLYLGLGTGVGQVSGEAAGEDAFLSSGDLDRGSVPPEVRRGVVDGVVDLVGDRPAVV